MLNYTGAFRAFRFAVSLTVGRRSSLEDTFRVVPLHNGHSFFGVFDGHGGDHLARLVAKSLPDELSGEISASSISDACLRLDRKIESLSAGSTAAFAVISPQGQGFLCTLGDARCLVVRNGAILFTSNDHSPELRNEQLRIERAGGSVCDDRVDGKMAVSRAFGDRSFKLNAQLPPEAQKIIPLPDVQEFNFCPNDVLVLATDGISRTAEGTARKLETAFSRFTDIDQIADDIVHDDDPGDNATTVVVFIRSQFTTEGPRVGNSGKMHVSQVVKPEVHRSLLWLASLHEQELP
eukprot:TRINITY_DN13937_c0_g1_i1.p1 TRINITY_DN13937_c0_g1~~TRINITY_DN13937_c0_g1_i1.p1  ORF type:complete len:293 (+),score=21.02 TRINITY_DN13937_c0_g1_i1:41-919(+)